MNSTNTWRVLVPKRVANRLVRLPKRDRERIQEILRDFESDPWLGDIAKIKGENTMWRRRVGNYRIFYSTYSDKKIVAVKEVERRTSKTY